jgi:hypothetical protein
MTALMKVVAEGSIMNTGTDISEWLIGNRVCGCVGEGSINKVLSDWDKISCLQLGSHPITSAVHSNTSKVLPSSQYGLYLS